MRQFWTITVHSTVDLITNSSSELFICSGTKSVEVIKEAILDCVKIYNAEMSNSKEKYHGDPINLDAVFDGIFQEPRLATENDTDDNYGFSWSKGQIILESWGDNSVPYELMEIIEKFLVVERYHLG